MINAYSDSLKGTSTKVALSHKIFKIFLFCLGNKFNFNKYNRGTIDSLGTKYDYGSVMHYGSRAFSKNGRPTIVAKQSGVSLSVDAIDQLH